MRWLCAPPRILRTCWTACIGILGVHFGRAMQEQPVVEFLGNEDSARFRGRTWRRGTRKQRTKQKDWRIAHEGLASATSDVLQAAEGVPGRTEVRGVCGGGARKVLSVTKAWSCHYRHKLAASTTINWPRMAIFRTDRSPNSGFSKDKVAASSALQA